MSPAPTTPTTETAVAFLDAFAAGVLEPFVAPIHDNELVILRTAAAGPVVFLGRLDRHRLDHGWRELPEISVSEVADSSITVWRDDVDPSTAARIHDPAHS